MDKLQETWARVEGLEFVRVSNIGRVRIIEHDEVKWGNLHHIEDHIVKQSLQGRHGKSQLLYPQVRLYGKTYTVHRLVAMAFLGTPSGKLNVNHLDGDTQNNCVTNLEWCTPKQNVRHAFEVLGRKGHPFKGSRRSNGLFVSTQV